MNSKSAEDTFEKLKDEGRSALDSVKDFARDKVIDPVVDAGKHLSESAREGAGKVADYSRRAVHSTDEWVGSHPYPTAGLAFFAGIILGAVLTSQFKS
jgi:ElaB/YqjD/DUF883 family membrane-anchored ribosome-binding protein